MLKLRTHPLTHVARATLLFLFCAWPITPVAAQETPPSGTVVIAAPAGVAAVGVPWGYGILTVQEQHYPFAFQGLRIMGVGNAKVRVVGTVYGLHQGTDFEGLYAAAAVGDTAGSDPATVTLRNHNRVTIVLQAEQQGVHLGLASAGVQIKFQPLTPDRRRP